MSRQRQQLVRVTAKDCRWDYYKGSGAGGQKKNKTENCVRCTHEASGGVGKSEDGRSKDQNKRTAFVRMAETKEFKTWLRLESMRAAGQIDSIEDKVKKSLKESVVEVKDGKKWIKAPDDLQVNSWDVMNSSS